MKTHSPELPEATILYNLEVRTAPAALPASVPARATQWASSYRLEWSTELETQVSTSGLRQVDRYIARSTKRTHMTVLYQDGVQMDVMHPSTTLRVEI